MFDRPHHRLVGVVLQAMDADYLCRTKCHFGGGTAVALLLGEFRESVDIGFPCADQEGYRTFRTSVFHRGLADLFKTPLPTIRDVRADRDGIRNVLSVDGAPIKFEIVREARIDLQPAQTPSIPVPCLSRVDMFAEKLLANADRFGDKAAMSRDVIDLLVMEMEWGPIPQPAWDKVAGAYGDSAERAFAKAKALLRDDPGYLRNCFAKMGIADTVRAGICRALGLQ